MASGARRHARAEGVRDQSRMAATRQRRGAQPASPTAVRRDALETLASCSAAPRPCPTKAGAINESHRLADRLYRETGHPTALMVPVGWGKKVMVGAYGRALRRVRRQFRYCRHG